MKISCLHCSQNLELDPETLAALQGQPHFACPTCQGLMAVPQVQTVAAPVGQAAPQRPAGQPQRTASPKVMVRTKKKGTALLWLSVVALGAAAAWVYWERAQPKAPATVDLIALMDPVRDSKSGVWKKTPEGLLIESGNGPCAVFVPYKPGEEYDFELEFTLQVDSIGNIGQHCVKNGKQVSWTLQSFQVGKVWSGFRIDSRQMEFSGANVIQPLLVKGVRYRSVVQVRRDWVRGFLNDKMLVEWKGEFKTKPPQNPTKPIAISTWHSGVLFHKASIINHSPNREDAGSD
jgi:hypothetical protein